MMANLAFGLLAALFFAGTGCNPSAASSSPSHHAHALRQSRDPAASNVENPELRRKRAFWPGLGVTQPKHALPTGKQVSAFLDGGRYKRFLYIQKKAGSPISLVVTPCSARLDGFITFYPDNVRHGDKEALVVERLHSPDQVIYSERRAEPGSYDINITAVADTYVHFLAADEDLAGLGALKTTVQIRNRPRGRAEVNWSPAVYGGQSLHYCLIASPVTHFSTVCGALSAKFGLRPPDGSEARRHGGRVVPHSHRRRARGDSSILVGCVDRRTQYELHELSAGADYRFTVFGQYGSVSFPYGATDFIYAGGESQRRLMLRHSDVTHLRLTSSNPKRRLPLRLSRRAATKGGHLHYFIAACGGAIRFRVLRGKRRPVQIHAADVSPGNMFTGQFNGTRRVWYQFELEALDGTTNVEVQATWRERGLRVAKLPDRPTVKAASRRRQRKLGLECGQLAVTMMRSRGPRQGGLHYCVLLEEDHSGRTRRRFKAPSVCGLDIRLKHSLENHTICGDAKQLKRGNRVEVVFSGLPPGQRYVVRAMVKPKGGRFLPYKLAQVKVPDCTDEHTNEVPGTVDVTTKQPIRTRLREPWAGSAEAAEEEANILTSIHPV